MHSRKFLTRMTWRLRSTACWVLRLEWTLPAVRDGNVDKYPLFMWSDRRGQGERWNPTLDAAGPKSFRGFASATRKRTPTPRVASSPSASTRRPADAMRFRATVENVQTLYRVVQSLEKLAKRCMITMNESTMRIICLTSDNGVQLWSSIKVPHIFTDYRIQSNNNNEITFEMGTEPLLAALKSALGSPEVVLKLTKKNDHATWSFEVAIQHNSGRRMNIVHDVRITVMRPADVARVHEPLCPEPDVHIILPPLVKLRTPMEHMQRISDAVLIKANHRETLRFMVKTDKCCLESEWTGCKHPNMDGDGTQKSDEEEPSDQFVSVLLPMKALFKFMSCHVVSTTTIAGLCHGHCVIMYVYIGETAGEGGVLTFYIPAISDGDD